MRAHAPIVHMVLALPDGYCVQTLNEIGATRLVLRRLAGHQACRKHPAHANAHSVQRNVCSAPTNELVR